MTVLIIIFISLSLMGSALWILPPKKERQRMALRMKARQLGLTVQLTSIDLPDKWDKSLTKHNVCAYALYRGKTLEGLPNQIWLLPYEVWKYTPLTTGWWSSHGLSLDERVYEILAQHGECLKALKITPQAVTFYWHEGADEAVLTDLSELLYQLAKIHDITK